MKNKSLMTTVFVAMGLNFAARAEDLNCSNPKNEILANYVYTARGLLACSTQDLQKCKYTLGISYRDAIEIRKALLDRMELLNVPFDEFKAPKESQEQADELKLSQDVLPTLRLHQSTPKLCRKLKSFVEGQMKYKDEGPLESTCATNGLEMRKDQNPFQPETLQSAQNRVVYLSQKTCCDIKNQKPNTEWLISPSICAKFGIPISEPGAKVKTVNKKGTEGG